MTEHFTDRTAGNGRLVVKFGGSMISNRSGLCQAKPLAMNAAVAALASYVNRYGSSPVVVLGGGAFAHPFAAIIQSDADADTRHQHADDMDAALADLRDTFVKIGKAGNLDAEAFCEHDMFDATATAVHARPALAEMLDRHDIVPVLTGGCFRLANNRFHLLSSDDLPAVIHGERPISVSAVLTDIQGVMAGHGTGDARLLSRVTPDTAEAALATCGANKAGDMTGGMLRKVSTCTGLMRKGISCYIGDGLDLKPDALHDIVSGQRPGTYFKPEPPKISCGALRTTA